MILVATATDLERIFLFWSCIFRSFETMRNNVLAYRPLIFNLLFSGFLLLSLSSLNGQDNQPVDLERKTSIVLNEDIAEELNNTINLAIVGDYIKARPIFNRLDSVITMERNPELRLSLLQWRAYMNKIERHFDESLADYLEMLAYYEEQNNAAGLAEVHTHLAEFHRARNLEEQAFTNLEIAESLFETAEVSPCLIAYWFSRRAACESQFRSDDYNVLFFAEKGLEISGEDCVYGTEGMLLNELGFRYGNADPNNESKVVNFYERAIAAFEEDDRQRDIITVKNNLANYYMRRLRYGEALALINEAIEIGEKFNWLSALEDSYFIKMATLDYLGRHEEAYRTSVTAYRKKIEQMNYQYSVRVEEIEERFEKELTEQALEEAQVEARKNEQAFIFSLIFAALLLIFMGILIWLTLRVRKNNSSLKKQQRTIKRTNDQLSQTLQEKELLYQELNHRVKNNLMILSGLIYMQEENETDENNKKLYEVLRMRIHSIALVHEKLYGMDETSEINFQEYLKELILLNFETLRGKSAIPSTVACQNLRMPLDQAIPLALIFNELINNVKKHALGHDGTAIEIFSEQVDDSITIIFRDNGPGLPPDFDLQKSQSMGLKIILLMSRQLKSEPEFVQGKKGLVFKLSIKRKSAQMSA